MKRLMIYSKHSNSIISGIVYTLKENSNTILLFSLFICGLILGCGIYNGYENKNSSVFTDIINTFFTQNNNSLIFINSFLSSLILILIIFCSGLCCVGYPAIYSIPLLKGLYYGIISSFMLHTYAMQGFSYFSLTVLPGAIISVCATVYACNISCDATRALASNIFTNSREELKIKEYLLKHLILFAVMLIGCIIDYFTVTLFSKIFSI